MALDIHFAYICQKKFTELPGTSDFKRHCTDCGLDVVNLDPLDERARLELFESAAQSGQRLCVSATQPVAESQACKPLPPPIRTAGLPVMPPPEKLRHERARIEQSEAKEEGGFLKWLQSKF